MNRRPSPTAYLSIFAALLAVCCTLCIGCFSEPDIRPPEPQPPEAAVNVIVLVDPSAEQPEHAAVYCDPQLRSYCERSGHELRIVDACAPSAGYLKPYYEAAAKVQKGPPVLAIGRGKNVLCATTLHNTAQGVIDQVEKTVAGDEAKNSIWAGGSRRYLGCLPMAPGAAQRWPVEGSAAEPLIPRDRWVDVDFSGLAAPTIDQDGYSSCCACASGQALVTSKTKAGLQYTELSVVDIYYRGNGGRDRGMMLEDGMRILLVGVCDTEHAAMWGITRTAHKGDWQANRKESRALHVTLCPSVEHAGSALQRYRVVVFGTMVGANFTPNADGLIGPKSGNPRGGHAMYLVGIRKINGQWYFLVINSWGKDWGRNGRAWIHESWIDPAFGAWAIATVAMPESEPLRQRGI